MAPGQVPHPAQQQKQPSRYKYAGAPFLRPPFNPQREYWVKTTKDRFHHLILVGESEPSNGTVRRVDRANGETRYAVAYGSAPDRDLHLLLESIYARHGEVTLQHNGRDSTGKHWIKCFSEPRPGTVPTERAVICVSSKLELAALHSFRAREALAKGKGKAPRAKKAEWPPKVPGAVPWAPEHLFLMPWHRQLPWLEPAAAHALREKIEAGCTAFRRRQMPLGEAQRAPRG